ncbi:MAG: DNA translocase FtsK 4TM domain-containing protein [Candidatus Altimarinota bacterium]
MARRRTRSRSRRKSTKRKPIVLNVPKSVMREITGVFYLGLGVFTILSLNNSFGIVGNAWLSLIRPILGWGIYIFPVGLIVISLLYFLSKKISFTLSRILGVFLLMISVLAILHLSVPMEDIRSVAQAGEYGGQIGFMMNFLFREFFKMGSVGAFAVFMVGFLVSILLAFEISLVKVIKFLKPDLKLIRINQYDDAKGKKGEVEVEEDEEEEVEDDYNEDEIVKKIDQLPDSEFGMPVNYEEEPTLKIRRAAIRNDAEKAEEAVEVASETRKTRKIEIKNENDEALTSKVSGYTWQAPSLDLLSPAVPDIALDDDLLSENARKIQAKLDQFGIKVAMHEVHVGPTVVQYTLKPHEGVKLSKITALKNDLALALSATAVRIEAPIPGKGLVGIEVPNDQRSVVHLREVMESKECVEIKSSLRFPLGRDVAGKPMIGDLASMPHLLIAGATGSGKSVGMNTLIISLLYQNSPEDLRLILVDPKRVELTTYNGIAHLLTPVITDPEKAAIALRWAVAEMNRRYQLCAEYGCRSLTEYNQICEEKRLEAEEGKMERESLDEALGEEGAEMNGESNVPEPLPQKMPKIVIIIDELADLMMSAGKEVEASICRIAQMARAVGMHLVLATQRPSVDVITGLIKANVPARIAFAVSSSIDSRTIIDSIGAEDLLGKGDMLYLPGGMSRPTRIQGIFVSSKEIERVVNNIKINGEPAYHEDIISPKVAGEAVQGLPKSSLSGEDVGDDLYEQALNVVMDSRKASASLLQRRLKIGYARAARLLDLMEENGAIGPVNGAKAREIYIE